MLGRLASSGRVLLLRGSENPFASVQTPSVDLRILSSLPRTSRRNETRYLSSDAAAVQQEGDGGSTGDQVGGGEGGVGGGQGGGSGGGRPAAEYVTARREYRQKIHELRVKTKAEVEAKQEARKEEERLERLRVVKEKAQRKAMKREQAVVGERRQSEAAQRQKERYEGRWAVVAQMEEEKRQRRASLHALLVEKLNEESVHWITSAEKAREKITDALWEAPADTAGRSGDALSATGMPDSQYWRFGADVGLPEAEEEPSEGGIKRAQMAEKMSKVRLATRYIRWRKRKWSNDTRGLAEEAERVAQWETLPGRK